MIEPQEHLKPDFADLVADPKCTLLTCAVSDRPGKARFAQNDWDVTSHLVTEDETPGGGDKFVEVDVITVSDLAAKRGRAPDLLKIDAEGFDLQVLDGARDVLGKTEIIVVEVALLNPEMPNDARTVLNRLDEAGYRLLAVGDINHCHWPNGFAPGLQWLSDFVFVRKDGPLWATLKYPARDKVRFQEWSGVRGLLNPGNWINALWPDRKAQ